MSTDASQPPTLPPKVRRTAYLKIAIPEGHIFNGYLIANTAKRFLPALDRSFRSKYTPHVGKKQLSKLPH